MSKCVYFLYDNNNVVRYIGQGNESRTKEINHSSRSKEFKDIYFDGGRIEVFKAGLLQDEAVNIERDLISRYSSGEFPEWNLINKMSGYSSIEIKFEELDKILQIDYRYNTFLSWKYDRIKKNGRPCSKARVGYRAGCIVESNSKSSYVVIDKRSYSLCRVVWSLHNKSDLSNLLVINHKDGDRLNNHPDNLEAVSQKENIHKTVNRKPNNSTGIVGVRKIDNKNSSSYMAYVSDPNKKQIMKSFNILKYGDEKALGLALAWRDSKMKEFYGEDLTYSNTDPSKITHISNKINSLTKEDLKELEEVDIKYVVNRKRLFDSSKDLATIFGYETISFCVKDWINDGYVGLVRNGYLVEHYDPTIHSNAQYDTEILPVEELKVPIVKAFINVATEETFLSAPDFSIRRKGFNDKSTCWLLSTQTKKGMSVYGNRYRFGDIDDLNAEIIRRVERRLDE